MMRIFGWICILLICCASVHAFPLKSKNKGDIISVDGMQALNGSVDAVMKESALKLMLLWRSDKRTSKVIFKEFAKVCKGKKIPCLAVEMKGAPLKDIETVSPSASQVVTFAHDPNGITKDWGVFTLPVTLVLDKQNMIIDALGYEGQYDVKLARFIDLQRGDISQTSYDKVSNVSKVDRKSCQIASLNFIDRLIKSGQKEDAVKKLKRIDPIDLRPEGKLKYAEISLKLKTPESVVPMLQEMSKINIGAKFYLAYAYYQQEKYDDSMTLLNEIAPIYPKKEKVHYLIGHIYHAKGDYKNAAAYYAKSCNSDLF